MEDHNKKNSFAEKCSLFHNLKSLGIPINGETKFEFDPQFEFDAPQWSNTLEDDTRISSSAMEENIDPWFLTLHKQNHTEKRKTQPANVPKKKNFQQFQKDNHIQFDKKKPQAKKLDNSFNAGAVNLDISRITQTNLTINNTNDTSIGGNKSYTFTKNTNQGNRKSNVYKPDLKVTLGVAKCSKVKRGISVDTYEFYENNDSFLDEKKKKDKKNNYCPRIHSDKVLKKWEQEHGVKWYSLSPNSRQKANKEMDQIASNMNF